VPGLGGMPRAQLEQFAAAVCREHLVALSARRPAVERDGDDIAPADARGTRQRRADQRHAGGMRSQGRPCQHQEGQGPVPGVRGDLEQVLCRDRAVDDHRDLIRRRVARAGVGVVALEGARRRVGQPLGRGGEIEAAVVHGLARRGQPGHRDSLGVDDLDSARALGLFGDGRRQVNGDSRAGLDRGLGAVYAAPEQLEVVEHIRWRAILWWTRSLGHDRPLCQPICPTRHTLDSRAPCQACCSVPLAACRCPLQRNHCFSSDKATYITERETALVDNPTGSAPAPGTIETWAIGGGSEE